MLFKPRPPSSESSTDDYAFIVMEETRKKLQQFEEKRQAEKAANTNATDKQRLEEHLKRFKGFGVFKDKTEYKFDEDGDLLYEQEKPPTQTSYVPSSVSDEQEA